MGTKGNYKIALLIDSPNIVRREYEFGLGDIVEAVEEYGDIILRKIYFTVSVRNEKPKLVEAAAKLGFECILGTPHDVDVSLGVDAGGIITAMDYIDYIDLIALATSDTDFLPVINKTKNHGKETLVLYAENCIHLQRASTYSVDMKEYVKNKKSKLQEVKTGV